MNNKDYKTIALSLYIYSNSIKKLMKQKKNIKCI